MKYLKQSLWLGLASALSQGSVSTAEVLLANEEIAAARQDFYRLLNQLEQFNPADIILWCEQWDKNKKMVRSLLELAQLWYHDLLICTCEVTKINTVLSVGSSSVFNRQLAACSVIR